MSADERRPGGDASSQVEDGFHVRPESAGTSPGPGGYAAGSEGGGSEIWEKEPYVSGGWEVYGSRGGQREAARRRVEAHPEVMPPHPKPTDRHEEKRRAAPSLVMRALPVAGLFLVGLLAPRLVAGRRTRRTRRWQGPELTLALRSRGRRGRREAERVAELLRGERFRGELIFE